MGLVRDCRYTEGCPKLEPIDPNIWCSLQNRGSANGTQFKWIDGTPVTNSLVFQSGNEGSVYLPSSNLTFAYTNPTIQSRIANCPNLPQGNDYSFFVVHVNAKAILVYTLLDCPIVGGYVYQTQGLGLGSLERGFVTHVPSPSFEFSLPNAVGTQAGVISGHFLYEALNETSINPNRLVVLRPSNSERVYGRYFHNGIVLLGLGNYGIYYDYQTQEFFMVNVGEWVYFCAVYQRKLYVFTASYCIVFDLNTGNHVARYRLQKGLSCGTVNLMFFGATGVDLSLMEQGIVSWISAKTYCQLDLQTMKVMRLYELADGFSAQLVGFTRYEPVVGHKFSVWFISQGAHCIKDISLYQSGLYSYNGQWIRVMNGLWPLDQVNLGTYSPITDKTAQSKVFFYTYGGNLAHRILNPADPEIATNNSDAIIPP